MNGEVAD